MPGLEVEQHRQHGLGFGGCRGIVRQQAMGFAGQREGMGVVAERRIAARQGCHRPCLDRRVGAQRQVAQLLLGELQHVARGRARIGQARQRHRTQRLLEHGGHGLHVAQLLAVADVGPADHAGAPGRHQDHAAGEHAGQRIALHEAPGHVGTTAVAGHHRASCQPVLEIIDQRIDAGIAVRRGMRDGLQRNGVQVAAQARLEPARAAQGALPCSIGRGRRRQRRGCPGQCRGRAAEQAGMQRLQRARPVPDQQLVQHHADRIDVTGGRGDAAREHFRCRVAVGDGEARHVLAIQAIDHRRQPEVDQVHAAIGGHQQIAWLDVLVQHAPAVRVLQRLAGLQQQADARGQREALLVGIRVHRRTVHQAHGEPGPAIVLDAAIQQRGDVRVVQLGQVVALAGEGLDQRRRGHLGAHALQRDLFFVLAIGPAGLVNRSHAAGLQHADDPPWAETVADAVCRCVGVGRRLQQRIKGNVLKRMRHGIRRQQPEQRVVERGLACLQALECDGSLRRRKLGELVEQR